MVAHLRPKQIIDFVAEGSLPDEIEEYRIPDLVQDVFKAIMVRKGAVINHDVAMERARNIAAGFVGATYRFV